MRCVVLDDPDLHALDTTEIIIGSYQMFERYLRFYLLITPVFVS